MKKYVFELQNGQGISGTPSSTTLSISLPAMESEYTTSNPFVNFIMLSTKT